MQALIEQGRDRRRKKARPGKGNERGQSPIRRGARWSEEIAAAQGTRWSVCYRLQR